MNVKAMKKWVALFLFLTFSYDVVLDSFDAQCQQQASAAQCHACVCQVHATNPAVVSEKAPEAKPICAATLQADLIERLFDKSLFHPPKLLS